MTVSDPDSDRVRVMYRTLDIPTVDNRIAKVDMVMIVLEADLFHHLLRRANV